MPSPIHYYILLISGKADLVFITESVFLKNKESTLYNSRTIFDIPVVI